MLFLKYINNRIIRNNIVYYFKDFYVIKFLNKYLFKTADFNVILVRIKVFYNDITWI